MRLITNSNKKVANLFGLATFSLKKNNLRSHLDV
jgi:hypothetical protein